MDLVENETEFRLTPSKNVYQVTPPIRVNQPSEQDHKGLHSGSVSSLTANIVIRNT